MGWELVKKEGRIGTGNWDAFPHEHLEMVYKATAEWKDRLKQCEKAWLCWNLNTSWCLVQQKMILDAGWTPVVGWDPNCPPKSLDILDGTILVDFNHYFSFPVMWPHFPLEFAFLWIPSKLAFWHADLLVHPKKFEYLVYMFDSLKPGEMAAVFSFGGYRNFFNYRSHRYWELIGCTTSDASRHQFDHGCGWWRHFYKHPNTPIDEKEERSKYYYDSGVGIAYWKKKYNRSVIDIKESYIKEGHCTEIGHKNYRKARHKGEELVLNYDLRSVLKKLSLHDYLEFAQNDL